MLVDDYLDLMIEQDKSASEIVDAILEDDAQTMQQPAKKKSMTRRVAAGLALGALATHQLLDKDSQSRKIGKALKNQDWGATKDHLINQFAKPMAFAAQNIKSKVKQP